MELEKIIISNFKGLQTAEYSPKSFTCLVGENNAGKSSVLQSVVFALQRPTNLPSNVFYDEAAPIMFRCTFSGITANDLLRLAEEHRVKIEPLVYEGRFSLVVRYTCGEKVEIKVLKKEPIEERLKTEFINERLKGKKGAALEAVIEEYYPEWLEGFPEGANITQAKEYLGGRIEALPPENFELQETPLPSGISSSIKNFLPDSIYIPAVKNINDDLKTTQSTSFGRLLGLLLEDLTPDLEDINTSLTNLKRILNRVVENGVEVDARHEKVRELEGLVESFLGENFPQAKVEMEIPPPELKTILNSAEIYIDDGSRDLIDCKGDGIKRSLTFALLRTYVHRLEAPPAEAPPAGLGEATKQPLVFLFEEPELYLHPKSQKILFENLGAISKSHQVMVTTHSPLFFAPGITAKFIRVSKNGSEPKPVGLLHPVDFELDAESAETFRLAKFDHAEAGFFSSKVVLFEGESDDFFLGHVAKQLNTNWDFDRENVAMVRVGGKGNFGKFRKFFESFGIKVLIIADLDAIFEGFNHLGATENCNVLRDQILQTIDQRIQELGISPELNSKQVRKKITKESWRERYENAKQALRDCQQGAQLTDELMAQIDALFVWEEPDAREKAIRDDNDSFNALIPLIDSLRNDGIFVLSKGPIEDYYPDGVPSHGAKPDRALRAIELLPDRDSVVAISSPLEAERPTELEEIFHSIFEG